MSIYTGLIKFFAMLFNNTKGTIGMISMYSLKLIQSLIGQSYLLSTGRSYSYIYTNFLLVIQEFSNTAESFHTFFRAFITSDASFEAVVAASVATLCDATRKHAVISTVTALPEATATVKSSATLLTM
jgi:uncharacterized protein YabN with tetrapyrrole methylase and pyrophosphatase domain